MRATKVVFGAGLAVLASVGFLFVSSPASATPACVTDTLAAYISLGVGGCTIGGELFFNFAGGGPLTPPSQFQLTPDSTNPLNPGIFISSGPTLTEAGGQTATTSLAFGVSGTPIHDVELTSGSATTTGPATITVLPRLNNQLVTTLPSCGANCVEVDPPLSSVRLDTETDLASQLNGTVTFDPTGQGAHFSLVPEPSTLALLVPGVLALIGMGRRWRKNGAE